MNRILKKQQAGQLFSYSVWCSANSYCGWLDIRVQVRHLKAYANADPLVNSCIDPRFKYVIRGCAEYVEWLGIQENPTGRDGLMGLGMVKSVFYFTINSEKILAILAAITGTKAGAGSGSAVSASGFPAVPFLVKVIVPDLNIRKSLSSADNSNLTGKVTGNGKFTIVEVSGKWGLLKSYKENQCFDV